MINFQNGNFHITDTIIVGMDKNYDDILQLAPTNKTWDIKNGYKWIYFNDIEKDDLYFHIGICFHNEKLFRIDFGFTNKLQNKLTWENWQYDDELKQKDLYENWLTKLIGDQRNFSWGKIGTYFDPRGGTSSISITYQ